MGSPLQPPSTHRGWVDPVRIVTVGSSGNRFVRPEAQRYFGGIQHAREIIVWPRCATPPPPGVAAAAAVVR